MSRFEERVEYINQTRGVNIDTMLLGLAGNPIKPRTRNKYLEEEIQTAAAAGSDEGAVRIDVKLAQLVERAEKDAPDLVPHIRSGYLPLTTEVLDRLHRAADAGLGGELRRLLETRV